MPRLCGLPFRLVGMLRMPVVVLLLTLLMLEAEGRMLPGVLCPSPYLLHDTRTGWTSIDGRTRIIAIACAARGNRDRGRPSSGSGPAHGSGSDERIRPVPAPEKA